MPAHADSANAAAVPAPPSLLAAAATINLGAAPPPASWTSAPPGTAASSAAIADACRAPGSDGGGDGRVVHLGKVPRVCKFYLEDDSCRRGAACPRPHVRRADMPLCDAHRCHVVDPWFFAPCPRGPGKCWCRHDPPEVSGIETVNVAMHANPTHVHRVRMYLENDEAMRRAVRVVDVSRTRRNRRCMYLVLCCAVDARAFSLLCSRDSALCRGVSRILLVGDAVTATLEEAGAAALRLERAAAAATAAAEAAAAAGRTAGGADGSNHNDSGGGSDGGGGGGGGSSGGGDDLLAATGTPRAAATKATEPLAAAAAVGGPRRLVVRLQCCPLGLEEAVLAGMLGVEDGVSNVAGFSGLVLQRKDPELLIQVVYVKGRFLVGACPAAFFPGHIVPTAAMAAAAAAEAEAEAEAEKDGAEYGDFGEGRGDYGASGKGGNIDGANDVNGGTAGSSGGNRRHGHGVGRNGDVSKACGSIAGNGGAEPPRAICRAWYKIDEVTRRAGILYDASWRAIDLGASPGGWTDFLAQRCATVVAVDPAHLAPAVAVLPNVVHVQKKAEDAHAEIAAALAGGVSDEAAAAVAASAAVAGAAAAAAEEAVAAGGAESGAAEAAAMACSSEPKAAAVAATDTAAISAAPATTSATEITPAVTPAVTATVTVAPGGGADILVSDVNMPPEAMLRAVQNLVAAGLARSDAVLVLTCKNFCGGRAAMRRQVDGVVAACRQTHSCVESFRLFAGGQQEVTIVARQGSRGGEGGYSHDGEEAALFYRNGGEKKFLS